MQRDIWELAVFEKLTKVSRANSVYEVLCYLDLEIDNDRTVINVLLRNEKTGEYIKDSIAPEYMKFCSVGSCFKGGKKMRFRSAPGVVRNIEIDVPELGAFQSIGAALKGTGYEKYYLQSATSKYLNYSKFCLSQKCVVFTNDVDKVIIPCSVIAATFYLTSHSMRVQLFAQNLKGLYEDAHYDKASKTACIILHRNARTEDAHRIARFHISDHARKCWDSIMNVARKRATTHDGKTFYPLVAKIPVVQDSLKMKVRGQELPNDAGGTTLLVYEILKEYTTWPFEKLLCGRRGNAKPAMDAATTTEKDAKSNDKLTNESPSKAYKGHWVRQFGVPSNPLWEKVEFEEITLPPLFDESDIKTVTEKDNGTVDLSPQSSKGNDPDQRVAKANLQPEEPKPEPIRMALAEFREMVAEFEGMEGISQLDLSSDMKIPLKGDRSRTRYTLRESYDGNPSKRRHYTYATFNCNGRYVCLVEIDQSGISTHVGTFVMSAAHAIGATEAEQAAKDFAQALSIRAMESQWKRQGIAFATKSHPPRQEREMWGSWRERVLEMISTQ